MQAKIDRLCFSIGKVPLGPWMKRTRERCGLTIAQDPGGGAAYQRGWIRRGKTTSSGIGREVEHGTRPVLKEMAKKI